MDWMRTYHDDHMAVLLLLAKLQGNLKDLESNAIRPNINFELEEFGDVLKNVIVPHFKSEEAHIYPKASEKDKEFIKIMYDEHFALYELFNTYLEALKPLNKEQIVAAGEQIVELLKQHIEKEETILPGLLKP